MCFWAVTPATRGSRQCWRFPPRWCRCCRRTGGFSHLLVCRWDSAWLCTGTGTAPVDQGQVNNCYCCFSIPRLFWKHVKGAACKIQRWGKQSYYYRWTTTHRQRIVRRTTYDVAKDSWSHEVRQLGRLEDIDRTFGLQLASQRRQSAERSCRDSAHTENKPPK